MLPCYRISHHIEAAPGNFNKSRNSPEPRQRYSSSSPLPKVCWLRWQAELSSSITISFCTSLTVSSDNMHSVLNTKLWSNRNQSASICYSFFFFLYSHHLFHVHTVSLFILTTKYYVILHTLLSFCSSCTACLETALPGHHSFLSKYWSSFVITTPLPFCFFSCFLLFLPFVSLLAAFHAHLLSRFTSFTLPPHLLWCFYDVKLQDMLCVSGVFALSLICLRDSLFLLALF